MRNEDLVSVYEDTLEYIKMAIEELKGVDEYKEILTELKEIKCEFDNEAEMYLENAEEEYKAEMAAANAEYERSRI